MLVNKIKSALAVLRIGHVFADVTQIVYAYPSYAEPLFHKMTPVCRGGLGSSAEANFFFFSKNHSELSF